MTDQQWAFEARDRIEASLRSLFEEPASAPPVLDDRYVGVQVWREPSLEDDWYSRALLLPRPRAPEATPVLREIRWDRAADSWIHDVMGRLEHAGERRPQPTIHVSDRELTRTAVNAIMERIRAITVEIPRPGHLHLDGITYGLRVGGLMEERLLRVWVGDGTEEPSEWQAVSDLLSASI